MRGGVHQVAYARALEKLTGADLTKLFPAPADPDGQDPGVPAAHRDGPAPTALSLLADDYLELAAVFNGPHPETGEDLEVVDEAPEGVPPMDLPAQPTVFAPDHAPEEIAEIAQRLRKAAGLPRRRPASSPTTATARASSTRSRMR